MKTKTILGLVLLFPILVIAETPTSQPAEIRYKNKVRTQAWFDEQYDKFKYNFQRQKNGKWKDIGFKICKMQDDGIDQSYPPDTLARVGEDFKYAYLNKSIKGKDVVVHKAFNRRDRVYIERTPRNQFTAMSGRQAKELTVDGKFVGNPSWTFDFIVVGYADGRKVSVGDRIKEGVFICEQGYKAGNMPVWSEVRPITQDEFKEVLDSNITLYDYSVKTTTKTTRKGKVLTRDTLTKRPIN